MAPLFALLVGFWLAGLQVSMFLLLQAYCTATIPSFLAVTAGWLVGSLVGLWLPPRLAWLGICLGGIAPCGLQAALRSFPFQPGLLPLFAGLVVCAGLYSGQFFRSEQAAFSRPARLFFWENNGFVLGLGGAGLASLFLGTRIGNWWSLGGIPILVLWWIRNGKRKEKSAIVG